MANLLRKGNRTEAAVAPAPKRVTPVKSSRPVATDKADDGAVNPWDRAKIWMECVTKEQVTRKQWEEMHGWMADYDPRGNLKPRKRPPDNSSRFSDKVPNSRGHDYGWRLNSNLGHQIQHMQTRFDSVNRKRVPTEVLGYD